MFDRIQRTVFGVLAVGVLTLPCFTAVAAQKKKAPAKPKPAAKADAVAGKKAFQDEGCTACHKSKDYPKGSEVGPDLSTIGKTQKAAQIAAYIKKPKAGSIMPASKAPQKVIDDMTAYLLTQK